MSLWHLVYVKDGPRNLPLKFGQNGVSDSWYIADIKFVWWLGGVVFNFIFMSNPTNVEPALWLSWGCDNSY